MAKDFLNSLHHRFLDEDRKAALQKFEEAGFPTKKDEEYNTLTLKRLLKKRTTFFRKKTTTFTKGTVRPVAFGRRKLRLDYFRKR